MISFEYKTIRQKTKFMRYYISQVVVFNGKEKVVMKKICMVVLLCLCTFFMVACMNDVGGASNSQMPQGSQSTQNPGSSELDENEDSTNNGESVESSENSDLGGNWTGIHSK